MASWTDESFMKAIEEEYGKDFDWDSVPDPETLPDVYVVEGIRADGTFFSVSTEFKTKKEAEAQIERMKTSPLWQGKTGEFPPIHFPSVKITTMKPMVGVWLWVEKMCVQKIREGQKMFPVYLP